MQDVGADETLFSYKRMAAEGSRFRILKDEILNLEPATAVNNASASTISVAFKRGEFQFQYVPKEPIVVNIKSGNSTPTIAGLVNHNFFMLVHSGGDNLEVRGATRCYYVDL